MTKNTASVFIRALYGVGSDDVGAAKSLRACIVDAETLQSDAIRNGLAGWMRKIELDAMIAERAKQ